VKDSNRTITDLIGEYTAKIGEKLDVRRFSRFQLGEGIDQKGATQAG
jgi:elongation factor Ts